MTTDADKIKQVNKTVAEKLDAARNGTEFGAVLSSLFLSLEKQRDDDSD